jgi:hypothetical protein
MSPLLSLHEHVGPVGTMFVEGVDTGVGTPPPPWIQMHASDASHAGSATHEYLELASRGNTMFSTGPTGPTELGAT